MCDRNQIDEDKKKMKLRLFFNKLGLCAGTLFRWGSTMVEKHGKKEATQTHTHADQKIPTLTLHVNYCANIAITKVVCTVGSTDKLDGFSEDLRSPSFVIILTKST